MQLCPKISAPLNLKFLTWSTQKFILHKFFPCTLSSYPISLIKPKRSQFDPHLDHDTGAHTFHRCHLLPVALFQSPFATFNSTTSSNHQNRWGNVWLQFVVQNCMPSFSEPESWMVLTTAERRRRARTRTLAACWRRCPWLDWACRRRAWNKQTCASQSLSSTTCRVSWGMRWQQSLKLDRTILLEMPPALVRQRMCFDHYILLRKTGALILLGTTQKDIFSTISCRTWVVSRHSYQGQELYLHRNLGSPLGKASMAAQGPPVVNLKQRDVCIL